MNSGVSLTQPNTKDKTRTLRERGSQVIMSANVSRESISEETLGTDNKFKSAPLLTHAILAISRTTFDVTKAAMDMYRTPMKRMQARLKGSIVIV